MFSIFIRELIKADCNEYSCNIYRDRLLANNLKVYLDYVSKVNKNKILLVGEAPGWRGCKMTGIPFTSSYLIRNNNNKLFNYLRRNIGMATECKESTSTTVWNYLIDKNVVPMFWNAYPFHPHKPNSPYSNRKPTAQDLRVGSIYLEKLVDIYKPKKIGAIGRVAERSLNRLFPGKDILYIRHPANGGKEQFEHNMDSIIKSH